MIAPRLHGRLAPCNVYQVQRVRLVGLRRGGPEIVDPDAAIDVDLPPVLFGCIILPHSVKIARPIKFAPQSAQGGLLRQILRQGGISAFLNQRISFTPIALKAGTDEILLVVRPTLRLWNEMIDRRAFLGKDMVRLDNPSTIITTRILSQQQAMQDHTLCLAYRLLSLLPGPVNLTLFLLVVHAKNTLSYRSQSITYDESS